MEARRWEIFKIVLADSLASNRKRSGTGTALAAVDVTDEIMSVVGKMSKSSLPAAVVTASRDSTYCAACGAAFGKTRTTIVAKDGHCYCSEGCERQGPCQ